MEYTFQLTEEKVKRHQVTALHLTCALAFLGAGAIIYVYNFEIKTWGLDLIIIALAMLVITITQNRWITRAPGNLIMRFVELVLSVALCGYSYTQGWKFPIGMFGVLSAGLIYAMIWERTASSRQFVNLSDAGIKLPADSRRRFVEWSEVNEVIMKFGTLSVDCVDNRLYQWNVADSKINAGDFHDFCVKQIAAGEANRKKNDW